MSQRVCLSLCVVRVLSVLIGSVCCVMSAVCIVSGCLWFLLCLLCAVAGGLKIVLSRLDCVVVPCAVCPLRLRAQEPFINRACRRVRPLPLPPPTHRPRAFMTVRLPILPTHSLNGRACRRVRTPPPPPSPAPDHPCLNLEV